MSLFSLAAIKPKRKHSATTEVRLLWARDRSKVMSSFLVSSNYTRNLFQVLDFWYSIAMKENKSWTFLSNHGHVLVYLSRNPEARVKDIAAEIGITERSAQSILLELQESEYITKTKQGRRNTYRVNPKGKFRHPSEKSKSIGLLLEIFS